MFGISGGSVENANSRVYLGAGSASSKLVGEVRAVNWNVPVNDVTGHSCHCPNPLPFSRSNVPRKL